MRNHILKTAVVVVFAFAAVAVTQIAAAANGCKGGHGKCRTTVSGKATTTAASSALRYRFTYGNGTAAITTGSYGWNLADVGGKSAADALPAGMKGLVWVGDYDNSTCNWQMSDATLTTKVKSMGSLVGQSEERTRQALRIIDAMTASPLQPSRAPVGG